MADPYGGPLPHATRSGSPGLTAGQVPGPGRIELLVDMLLLHRVAQLPVLLDGHNHRYHLAPMVDHVMGVADRQFAHKRHGNEADRQPDATTRRLRAGALRVQSRLV
jgi:hypothetical protein